MNRRKFLATLGATVAGTSATVGTGAFTSVTTTRAVSVNVAGDESALLGLEAGPLPYISGTDGGQLEIDLTETEAGGKGVNTNAVTTLGSPANYEESYAFKIKNQGTQPVFISLSYDFEDESWINTGDLSQSDQSYVEFQGRGGVLERRFGDYPGRQQATFPHQTGSGNFAAGEVDEDFNANGEAELRQAIYSLTRGPKYKTLDVGNSWYFLVRVDTTGYDASIDDDLSGTLTIYANAKNTLGV